MSLSLSFPFSSAFRRLTRSLTLSGLGLGLAAAAASAAHAQTPAPPVTAGWQNGFFVGSSDGDTRLTFGAVIQTDGRFTTDDPAPFTNTFTIRKARPVLQGRLARAFDVRLMPEFGNGTATVLDAYVDVRFANAFRVRTGKDKTPVGLEVLQGDATLLFQERSLVSALLPSRDVGIQVQGDLAAGRLSYAAGVFNGVVDGTNSTTDVDTNAGKDVAARVQVIPFRTSTTAPALRNLGLHLGASAGEQAGTLPTYRTSAGQTFFSYAGTTADGTRVRVTPGVFYYHRAVGAVAEYARVSQAVTQAAATTTLTHTGWQVSGVINLTGEAASSGVVQPRQPFDPSTGHWGAVQLSARVAELRVDPAAFAGGYAATTASARARQVTVGLNWYPIQYVKYYLNLERTTFAGGAPRPAEHALLFRAQLAF